MDGLVEEDKKFDAIHDKNEEDDQPDPDEQLMLDQGNGRVWLVKIPKSLMARWAAMDIEDVHLASLRVYNDAISPTTGKKPRIILFLPTEKQLSSPDPKRPTFIRPPTHAKDITIDPATEPDIYELDLVNDSVENQIVVAERPKDPAFTSVGPGHNTRARTTILTGRIKHDCNLRPLFSKSYRKQMKERSLRYNTPKRQTKMIEEAGLGRGGINRLTSGVGVGAGDTFKSLVKQKPKPSKGTFERMARIPRNQLLDLLFSLFREQPRWSLKVLRERSQQPEVYLREVLSEVAFQHRSGEFNTLWELSEAFKDPDVKAEHVPVPSGSFGGEMGDVKMEDDNYDEDDDEDEDEDMEEVS